MKNRKPLKSEQAQRLFEAAMKWQAQGSRSKFSAEPTLALWDLVEQLKNETERMLCPPDEVPKVGQDIYVPSSFYLSRGRDDFRGGRCEVSKVEWDEQQQNHVVCIVERPSHGYYWESSLRDQQKKLAEEYGDERGRPDPDPDFASDRRDCA